MRGLLSFFFLFVKGLCVGATGILHGISGGSMALLLGVHQRFVFALASIDKDALRMLRQGNFQASWKRIDGPFLIVIISGVITGVLTLRAMFAFYYARYPIFISSFFFSLVIIAALLLLRKIKRTAGTLVFVIAGIFLSYSLTRIPPVSIPHNIFFDFFSGLIAGGTFIVPGVSGAFMLIFFAKYQHILASFGSLDIDVVVPFITGGIVGIFLFARLVATLLRRHFNGTVALFAGLMIGSLNKIWPWRQVLEYATTLQGKRVPAFDKSILPWRYLETTGKDPQIFYAILMMALGVLMVVIIEKVTSRLKMKG